MTADRTVAPRVRSLLDGERPPDKPAEVRFALALALAEKLDEAVDSDAAASAQAVSHLSRELRSVLEEIVGSRDEKGELLEGLFAPQAEA